MVTVVRARDLAGYLESLYRAAGMSGEDAATMAAAHVEADLRGIPGHGSRLAPGYLAKLRDGRLRPRPRMTTVSQAGATLCLDAVLAPGPVAARRAAEASIRLARAHGTGLVIARRTGHAGALGTAATWVAAQGLICVLAAPSSSPSVALLGGTGTALLGNSALAVALPAPGQPAVLDMAASSASWGRIRQLARAGQSLPAGSALDSRGQPARDPSGAAVLLPAGERGQAAAIILQAILGALSGSSVLPDGSEGRGLLALVIDPACLGPASMAGAVGALARAVRDDGARMPGDRAHAHRAAALHDGITLDDADLAALITAGLPAVPAPPAWSTPTAARIETPIKETP